MSGAIPPLPNTPSWRGAQLKEITGTTLPLRIAVNMLSSQGQPATDAPPAWGLGEGLTTPHCKKPACYEMLHRAGGGRLVNMVMELQVPYKEGKFLLAE
jgi:hypothetical protein